MQGVSPTAYINNFVRSVFYIYLNVKLEKELFGYRFHLSCYQLHKVIRSWSDLCTWVMAGRTGNPYVRTTGLTQEWAKRGGWVGLGGVWRAVVGWGWARNKYGTHLRNIK